MIFETSSYVNSIGLMIDIAGAILIFFNSPKIRHGIYMYNREELELLNKKALKQHQLAKMGVMLLIVGFVMQIISNLL